MDFKFDKEDSINICKKYEEGLSSLAIAKMFNTSPATICKLLRRYGVPVRTYRESHQKYKCNHFSFTELTPESVYWIGFLLGDGAIGSNKPSIKLNLQIEDIKQLEKFRSFVGSDSPITTQYRFKGSNIVCFCVHSLKMVQDLEVYGVVPRKSLIASVHEVLSFSRDFWRGLIDADGTVGIYNGRPVLKLVGSKAVTSSFLEYVKTVVSETKASVRPASSIYQVVITGRLAVKLMDHIYHVNCLSMDRKYNKARYIIENKSNFFKNDPELFVVNFRGEEAGSARLNENQVRQILKLKDECTHKELAIRFGVGTTTIGNIIHRRTWKHISI